jgi:hypothetical protein
LKNEEPLRLTTAPRLAIALLLAALTPTSAQENATDLLSKAADAFQRNQAKESNWTWVVEERAYTHDAAGKTVQQFPLVKVESLIRSDGRRCEAIVSWSDGWEPYPDGADNDTRCQLVEVDFDLAGLALQKLLKSRNATITEQDAAHVTIAVSPDKHLPSSDPLAKCAAVMQGTVRLDRATFFPQVIRAEVIANGCHVKSGKNSWYLVKGTSFELEYSLQKDRFGKTENDFWILARKRVESAPEQPGTYLMRNRKFAPNAPKLKQGLVSELHTVAQEFGSQSRISFEKP